MAYDSDALDCYVPRMGTAPAWWSYTSTDAHTTVDTTGYFTDGADRGLTAGDVMIVIDTNVPTCTVHHVSSATTVTVATLS